MRTIGFIIFFWNAVAAVYLAVNNLLYFEDDFFHEFHPAFVVGTIQGSPSALLELRLIPPFRRLPFTGLLLLRTFGYLAAILLSVAATFALSIRWSRGIPLPRPWARRSSASSSISRGSTPSS